MKISVPAKMFNNRFLNGGIFIFVLITVFSLTSAIADTTVAQASSQIKWEKWDEHLFEKADKEAKLVLLSLEAGWCHWCHVMAEKTYGNPKIIEIIKKSYISIKVDQDSRPDLAALYKNYGWPATIIFNSKGAEIRKLSGYIEPAKMLTTLQDSLTNPTPSDLKGELEVDPGTQSALSAQVRENLQKKHYQSLDMVQGGLHTSHKYLDPETIEYSFIKAAQGSQKDIDFIKTSLNSNLKLIDPVWGGVYQYSARSNWDNPHFEKIAASQADNLRFYSWAYALFGSEEYWTTATAIYTYLKNFLYSPEGAFYTSQDADYKKGTHSADYFKLNDLERRKLGVPSVDTNIYSRENGWIISALTELYSATGNKIILEDAKKAALWIINNRGIPGENTLGFKHGESDSAGPYLEDSLSMADAFLRLYLVSAERIWLERCEKTTRYILENFSDVQLGKAVPGFLSHKTKSSLLPAVKVVPDNIKLTRLLNMLYYLSGNSLYKEKAELNMRYLVGPQAISGNINDSGLLIADYEMSQAPLHITIVGSRDDPIAQELFSAGLKFYSNYKRLELWDKKEGPMPNPDVEYPQLSKPAAFVCTNKRCSLPIFKANKIAETIKLFHKD